MNTLIRYNLKKRTQIFSENIIYFCSHLPQTIITLPLITQLVRSGTSIGANYCEADNAESKPDFKHKIGIVKKEADETEYWLNLISFTIPTHKLRSDKLSEEAHELLLIFNSIFNKSK